jgi:hypothetical protein
MRVLLVVLAVMIAAGAQAQPQRGPLPSFWSVLVEQDGKTMPFSGVVRLKKAPFVFVIAGPRDYGFAVIASTGEAEIKAMTSKAAIDRYIRPTMMIAVSAPRQGRSLFVNKEGRLRAGLGGFDVWEENHDDGVLSFQTVRDMGQGMIARREINEISLGDGDKDPDYPVTAWPGGRIHMVITGNPPAAGLSHFQPLQATLEFTGP